MNEIEELENYMRAWVDDAKKLYEGYLPIFREKFLALTEIEQLRFLVVGNRRMEHIELEYKSDYAWKIMMSYAHGFMVGQILGWRET
jgi:hypothetical protein